MISRLAHQLLFDRFLSFSVTPDHLIPERLINDKVLSNGL